MGLERGPINEVLNVMKYYNACEKGDVRPMTEGITSPRERTARKVAECSP